ncbi:bifunctional metallophosphatase/5'-nucleotidase [Paucibacter sp. KCTC 42545]|uniref:bifunctional metallophosphatase/5'-nucleotidase n=1 Tax=Paucibacter sp. KCTC 42545 TaxID=1768242 RepID=UPI000733B0D3|nr:bifunctional metallophosphatase/5'-nucleotidase [Paucibacter sp. KCTC 42545]ALT78113.1 bifunctional metallophosphatase/5'-nucleotidase [Paucibacter sp. KCTC 42545]
MHKHFRPLLPALALALSAAFGAGVSHAAAIAPIKVKIVGFNDYHGTLESPGTFGANTSVPSASRPAVGGAEYLAAYVAQMRASNPNTVVVGGGDFIGASPLISALFYDEPAVETLNKIGVDFSAVGNHEFDKGKDELRRLQMGGCKLVGGVPDANSCKGFGSSAPGTFDGAKFKWLSANVIETATGRPLLPAYGVKSFNGVKVAFIGMTLKGTPGIVTPTGVAGLSFQDEADTVNALVPKLRAQGIEAIVVLVHQGGFQNAAVAGGFNNSDINGCLNNLNNSDGSTSDIGKIVARLDNAVDLVVSAHTHAAYNCSKNSKDNGSVARSAGLPNKAGRLVPVTSASAFGRVLTEIDLQIDPISRDVIDVSPLNRLVDRTNASVTAAIAANPEVKNVVAAYKGAASPLANQVIAVITAGMTNAANAAGEMEAGDLIADAQLQATQPAALGGASVAFMNAGGVRSPGFVKPAAASYPYALSYADAFTAQPFGNSLVTMTLTAQQIKDVLEQQFVGCKGQSTQRIMQVSNGLRYSWSASAPACAKIVNVTLTPTDVSVYPPQVSGPTDNLVINGVVQNPGKTYRVTVNNFMATGGDGFTTFISGANVLGGAQDIDALVAYLSGYKAPAAPYNPSSAVLSKPRISQLP